MHPGLSEQAESGRRQATGLYSTGGGQNWRVSDHQGQRSPIESLTSWKLKLSSNMYVVHFVSW